MSIEMLKSIEREAENLDSLRRLAERTFYTEIDEQLAADIVRYAQQLHTLYATPPEADK